MSEHQHTAAKLIKLGEASLKEMGLAAARWEAEVLLAHVMGWSRSRLYQNMHDEIDAESARQFEELLVRRATHVPLQYILGSQDFMGLSFQVDERVLIPRPETELLVERVLFLLQGRTRPIIADLGTGSGAIAVSCAVYHPTVEIIAVDISADALDLARENACRHQVEERIRFFNGDMMEVLKEESLENKLDGIVSNPPYIADPEIVHLEEEVRDHEPRKALAGGPDGLSYYRDIAAKGRQFLKEDGFIALEIGYDQGVAVTRLLETEGGFEKVSLQQDYAGRDRIVWAAGVHSTEERQVDPDG